MKYEDLKNTIFDIDVSAFKNCKTNKSNTVNLALWLTSDKYQVQQTHLRTISNKKERDEIKIQLPAITPSALLKSREKDLSDTEKLISYSGFMQIDIDLKDNLHLTDYNELLQKLPLIQNIAFCGQSVSGTGYYCLVPITKPEKLALHFLKFNELMREFFNIKLDTSKGGNFTDLRIYSYTPNAYFNINAIPFNLLYQPKPIKLAYKSKTSHYTDDKFSIVLERHNVSETFRDGNQNNYLVNLSGYCNVKGIDINETLQGCYQFINDEYTKKRISEIVTSVYNKHKSKHNTRPFKEYQNKVEVKPYEIIEPTNDFRKVETFNKNAFVNESGNLFIETPCSDTYTVYLSIEHYNKRLCLPGFQKKESVKIESLKTVIIDLETLKVN